MENLKKFIEEFISNLPSNNLKYTIEEENNTVKIDITGEDTGYLIGYRGEVLNSIQAIVSNIASKYSKERIRVQLNIGGYREKREKDLEIFRETSRWLNLYFSGKNPNFTPKYKIKNLTPFRQEVIDIMNTIQYGNILTYNDISKIIAKKRGLKRMSAQAVGGAVGWNPICIIIPCHRVVGTNGSLTGYGGGIKNKVELLKLEGNDMSKYSIPKRGTAL